MATKAKESSIVGKEKKAPSSKSTNSHITSTKRTIKPSTTTIKSTNKPNSTSSNKSIPNYLKPTKSPRLESLSSKQPKNDPPNPNNKPSLDRRRTLDKPLSSSNLTKKTQPSNSRLQKAVLSPAPRESSASLRSSIGPIKKSTNLSKPISSRTLKPQSDGKTKPLVANIIKKKTPGLSTSKSTKRVANNDHASSPNSTRKIVEETIETSSVDTEVKEVTSQEVEVIKVDNEEDKHEVEYITNISPEVELVHDIVHVHELENFEPPQDQADDERVISTVSETEEAEKEPQQEKPKFEAHKLEGTSTNQDEGNNNGNDHQEEHFVAEGEVAINEKEDKDEGEGGATIIEDHKSENNNNEEEVAEVEKEEVEEHKVVEPTQSNQNLDSNRQRNMKESQVSNDMIEETTSKLLEERKNKVLALAGAFQTVIDCQSTSK
ncbi:hypothetical protein VNO77_30501 [Canavalia gladiata]|uniref:Calmodulin-binding domain-containing protein n=1 Tax=Canavalia gladiata TaxID=3824 RepID=A0AAN9KR55_CANGL